MRAAFCPAPGTDGVARGSDGPRPVRARWWSACAAAGSAAAICTGSTAAFRPRRCARDTRFAARSPRSARASKGCGSATGWWWSPWWCAASAPTAGPATISSARGSRCSGSCGREASPTASPFRPMRSIRRRLAWTTRWRPCASRPPSACTACASPASASAIASWCSEPGRSACCRFSPPGRRARWRWRSRRATRHRPAWPAASARRTCSPPPAREAPNATPSPPRFPSTR